MMGKMVEVKEYQMVEIAHRKKDLERGLKELNDLSREGYRPILMTANAMNLISILLEKTTHKEEEIDHKIIKRG